MSICTNVNEIKRLLNSLLWEIYGRIPSSTSQILNKTRLKGMNLKLYEPRKLSKLNINVINDIREILDLEIRLTSKYLERVLISRDKNRTQQVILYGFLNVIISSRLGDSSREMRFSLSPPPGPQKGRGDSGRSTSKEETNSSSDFNQWLHAMKMVARLPGGMPPEFRRKLWLALSDKYLKSKNVDWEKEEIKCFSEQWREDDEELGIQIVKDLHRTGSSLCSGPAGTINQAKLKRILLGYARYNPKVGYCQGFNMLGALILQVMDKEEIESIKVMIYLVEGILPEGYFSGSLGGLQADMAVFRELMTSKLPRLAKHLQKLQGPVENAFEPPLTNVFTMQWFLTMFCTCLPMTCVLRVWDLVLIEGSDVLLRTALVLWSLLEERILNARTADDFYCKMGSFSSELLNGHLIDSNGLIEKVVELGPIPELQKLRDKHLYNISPFRDKKGIQLYYSDEEGDSDEDSRMAVATAWGLRLSRRGSAGLSNKADGKERIALDISLLKKQYDRLRERQRQAHIILTSAVARQGSNPSQSSIQMNQLLIGRNAIVTNNGRRLGPPQGAIPPARKPSLPSAIQPKPPQNKPLRRGETLHWRDTDLTKRRRASLKWKDIKSDSSQSGQDDQTPAIIESAPSSRSSSSEPKSKRASLKARQRSDSSSYSEDSDGNSSTSTSLCDEDDHDIGNVSSLEGSPLKKTKSIKKHSEVPQKKCLEDVLNSNDKHHSVDSQIPFIQLTTMDSPVSNANKTNSDCKEDSETESNRLDIAGFVDEYSWPIINETTSSAPIENITIEVNSDEGELLSLSNAITSTSQLSPIPDIATYINNSGISPLRTPISAFGYANLEVSLDESKKFDVNDEGVTNEYFERVNIVERPTKLDLMYSLNEEDSIRNAFKSCQATPDQTLHKHKEFLNGSNSQDTSELLTYESSSNSSSQDMQRKMKVLLEYSNQSSLSFIAEAKHEISSGLFKNKDFDPQSLKYQPLVAVALSSVLSTSEKEVGVNKTDGEIFSSPTEERKLNTTIDFDLESSFKSNNNYQLFNKQSDSKKNTAHEIESVFQSKNDPSREHLSKDLKLNSNGPSPGNGTKLENIIDVATSNIPSTEDLEIRFSALEMNFIERKGPPMNVENSIKKVSQTKVLPPQLTNQNNKKEADVLEPDLASVSQHHVQNNSTSGLDNKSLIARTDQEQFNQSTNVHIENAKQDKLSSSGKSKFYPMNEFTSVNEEVGSEEVSSRDKSITLSSYKESSQAKQFMVDESEFYKEICPTKSKLDDDERTITAITKENSNHLLLIEGNVSSVMCISRLEVDTHETKAISLSTDDGSNLGKHIKLEDSRTDDEFSINAMKEIDKIQQKSCDHGINLPIKVDRDAHKSPLYASDGEPMIVRERTDHNKESSQSTYKKLTENHVISVELKSPLCYSRDHFGDRNTKEAKIRNADVLNSESSSEKDADVVLFSPELSGFENITHFEAAEIMETSTSLINSDNHPIIGPDSNPDIEPMYPLSYSEDYFGKNAMEKNDLEIQKNVMTVVEKFPVIQPNLMKSQRPLDEKNALFNENKSNVAGKAKKQKNKIPSTEDLESRFKALEKQFSDKAIPVSKDITNSINQCTNEKIANKESVLNCILHVDHNDSSPTSDVAMAKPIPTTANLEKRFRELEKQLSSTNIKNTKPQHEASKSNNAVTNPIIVLPLNEEATINSGNDNSKLAKSEEDQPHCIRKRIPSTEDLEIRFEALEIQKALKSPTAIMSNVLSPSKVKPDFSISPPELVTDLRMNLELNCTKNLENRFQNLEESKHVQVPQTKIYEEMSKSDSAIPSTKELESRFEALEQHKFNTDVCNFSQAPITVENNQTEKTLSSTQGLDSRKALLEKRDSDGLKTTKEMVERHSKKLPSTEDLETRFQALEQSKSSTKSCTRVVAILSDSIYVKNGANKTEAISKNITNEIVLDQKVSNNCNSTLVLSKNTKQCAEKLVKVPSTQNLETRFEAVEKTKVQNKTEIESKTLKRVPSTKDLENRFAVMKIDASINKPNPNDVTIVTKVGSQLVPQICEETTKRRGLHKIKSQEDEMQTDTPAPTRFEQTKLQNRSESEHKKLIKVPSTQDLENRFDLMQIYVPKKNPVLETTNMEVVATVVSQLAPDICNEMANHLKLRNLYKTESQRDETLTGLLREKIQNKTECEVKNLIEVPLCQDLEKSFNVMQINSTKQMKETTNATDGAIVTQSLPIMCKETTEHHKRRDLYKLESQSDEPLTASDQTSTEFETKVESRPTSCPEYSDAFDSNVVTTDRVLKIIEENSKILHRILKKTLADSGDMQTNDNTKNSHPGITDSLLALGNIFPRTDEHISPSHIKSHSWIRPSITLRSDDNISDRLASIKSTIKSIDTLCEEKSFRKEKCQRYIDSLFARPTTAACVNTTNKIDLERKPGAPKDRIAKRELKKDISPRRRRDEDREENESRVRRDMMPNSLDSTSDLSFSLANIEQVDSEVNRINQVDTQLERPLSPYYTSGYDLNHRPITPVMYIPTKLEIRHTTVTSTFYDRYLTEKHIEKTFPKSKRSPISPTITKSYLDISKYTSQDLNDRSSKSAENSPSRLKDAVVSLNKTISSTPNKRNIVSTLEVAQKDLHIRSCDNILLQLRSSTNNKDIVPSIMVYNAISTKVKKPPELGISLGLYKDYDSDESSKS